MTKLKQAGAIKEVFYLVASQYGGGEKEEWEVASVCELHQFE